MTAMVETPGDSRRWTLDELDRFELDGLPDEASGYNW